MSDLFGDGHMITEEDTFWHVVVHTFNEAERREHNINEFYRTLEIWETTVGPRPEPRAIVTDNFIDVITRLSEIGIHREHLKRANLIGVDYEDEIPF